MEPWSHFHWARHDCHCLRELSPAREREPQRSQTDRRPERGQRTTPMSPTIALASRALPRYKRTWRTGLGCVARGRQPTVTPARRLALTPKHDCCGHGIPRSSARPYSNPSDPRRTAPSRRVPGCYQRRGTLGLPKSGEQAVRTRTHPGGEPGPCVGCARLTTSGVEELEAAPAPLSSWHTGGPPSGLTAAEEGRRFHAG